jgi:DNA-3-methyladenine glycosylase I
MIKLSMEKCYCPWCGDNELYLKYHNEEWGNPVHDDYKHFEFIVLESAQAGLSWLTILKKRENYRVAFDNFDFEKVARYDENKVQELLNNKGIIRNEKKIRSAISNAKAFIKIREEFGSFDKYIWKFVNFSPIKNNYKDPSQIPSKTPLSIFISKELKKYGFTFFGPTITYSYMQAVGLVDDRIKM